MAMSNSHRNPWSLQLIDNFLENIVFLGLQVFNFDNSNMFSCGRNAQVTIKLEVTIENK